MTTPASTPAFAPGDLVAIETPGGVVHVEVTHDPPSYPPVVRILSAVGELPTGAVQDFLSREAVCTVIVPLGQVLDALGWPSRVVHRRQGGLQPFPRFRMPVRDREGTLLYWWIWDGSGLHPVDDTPDLARLPRREVLSAERFRRLIETMADAA